MTIRSFLTLFTALLITVLPACGGSDPDDPDEEGEAEAEGEEGEAEGECFNGNLLPCANDPDCFQGCLRDCGSSDCPQCFCTPECFACDNACKDNGALDRDQRLSCRLNCYEECGLCGSAFRYHQACYDVCEGDTYCFGDDNSCYRDCTKACSTVCQGDNQFSESCYDCINPCQDKCDIPSCGKACVRCFRTQLDCLQKHGIEGR